MNDARPSLASFPVPITFAAVDLEEDATIEIVADLQSDPPSFDSFADAMNCIASVLSWGACPAPSVGTTERPAVTLLPPETTSSVYRQSWRTRGLHPGAYRMLLSMLAQLHFGALPLTSVGVHAFGKGGVLTFGDVLDAGFPAPPIPLPFEPQIPDDVLALDEMVFRIRFATKEVSRFFSQVQLRLIEWNNLVALGGYLETFEEADLPILPRETTERYADTIEHWICAVSLNRAAVDGLLNVLCRIHGAVNPIVELEIE
jgi:hypothetical protein